MMADFTFIRYANCWEDADRMLLNLHPVKGNRVLSIASAGDNTLAFLSRSPSEVLGFDINPTQLFLSELKQKAIQFLDRSDVLSLLGFTACSDRLSLLKALKGRMSEDAYGYFQERPQLIEAGIIHSGKFENYFRIFREKLLPLIHSKRKVDELFREKSQNDHSLFFHEQWDTWRWKMMFRFFFSKWVMGRLGRDPSFFKEVEDNVGKNIYQRASSHLSSIHVFHNHFLDYQLRGMFSVNLPFYLREENYEGIVNNIEKVRWIRASLTDLGSEGKFDCFNLSNIFEYMDQNLFSRQISFLKEVANDQAIIGYWNLLVPRSINGDMDFSRSEVLGDDLCFFYMNYNLYRYL